MEQSYRESRIDYAARRPMNPKAIWLMVCGVFAVGGYLYGVHNGTAALSSVSVATARVGSQAATHADNTLPIAPGVGQPSAPGDLLARASVENELVYTELQSFICSEHMDRFQSRLDGNKSHQVDTVSTQVSFENGVETYSDIHQNNRVRTSLSSLPGAWSEGEFGTLLRQTRTLFSTQPLSQSTTDLNGVPAALYRFYVSGEDSPWDLNVASKQYRLPFRTDVWVSKSTGEIIKIARTTTATPPDSGISEIQWDVDLKPVNLDGKMWLLPSSGEYSVAYQNSNHREWNNISFSNYHRYTSQSVIHF